MTLSPHKGERGPLPGKLVSQASPHWRERRRQMVQPGTVAARTVPLGSWPGRARYVPGGWGAGFATPMVLVGFSSASKNEDNLAPGLAGRQRIVGTIRQDGTGSGAPRGWSGDAVPGCGRAGPSPRPRPLLRWKASPSPCYRPQQRSHRCPRLPEEGLL